MAQRIPWVLHWFGPLIFFFFCSCKVAVLPIMWTVPPHSQPSQFEHFPVLHTK